MGKDIDILIGCAEVFAAIGLKRASRMIVDYLENPNSDKAEIFQKEVEAFVLFSWLLHLLPFKGNHIIIKVILYIL